MLKKVCMMHLSTVTSHNFEDVTRSVVFWLRELGIEILQHIDNAITLRKAPLTECAYQAKIAPPTHMTTLQTLYNDAEDHRRQIANGWAHSWKTNHEHGDAMATFSPVVATYPNAMTPRRWQTEYSC